MKSSLFPKEILIIASKEKTIFGTNSKFHFRILEGITFPRNLIHSQHNFWPKSFLAVNESELQFNFL